MIPVTPWEEIERSMLLECHYQLCVYMCIFLCVQVLMCIPCEWNTEDKLSCCSQSTLAFVRQTLSQAWSLPNRLGWMASESQGLLMSVFQVLAPCLSFFYLYSWVGTQVFILSRELLHGLTSQPSKKLGL